MGIEYSPAIDMFVAENRVFIGALQPLPGDQLSIVIHKTACGAQCTATQVAQDFATRVDMASTHFVVGRDGSVIQCVHLIDGAGGNCCIETGYDTYWQPFLNKYGNLNKCTFSIEHEDWTSDNSQAMTQAQLDASFALVKWLCQKYSIPASHIKTHASIDPISRARCPGSTYPMAKLIASLPIPQSNLYTYTQEEIDTWNLTSLNLPMQTGIAMSWSRAWRSNQHCVFGPPMTGEKKMTRPDGLVVIVQEFLHARCEDLNGAHGWFDGRGPIGMF